MVACRTCSAEIIACAARSLSLFLCVCACVWCRHTETVKHMALYARRSHQRYFCAANASFIPPIKLHFKVFRTSCSNSFIVSVKRRCLLRRSAVSDCEQGVGRVYLGWLAASLDQNQSVLTTCGTVTPPQLICKPITHC